MFFVYYINQNDKDTTHPWGRRLDTTLHIDQNVSQPVKVNFRKFGECGFFVPKICRFWLINMDILRSQKNLESRLFLYSLSQHPHQ